MTARDIVEGWRAGKEAWPEVAVEQEAFAAFVARSSSSAGGKDKQGGAPPRWADLYLACGCAQGDAQALAAFERLYLVEVDAAAGQIGRGAMRADELKQLVRHRLLVAEPGSRPKIAEYSGRGDLRGWVRVVAIRAGLNELARHRREVPLYDTDFTGLLGSSPDPELEYIRSVYAEDLRSAFTQGFAELDDRERTILRYALSDGLSVDALGALFNVHRATAARWVSKAHARLVRAVKKALTERLGGKKDYASILRVLGSQLHLTLDRYLSVQGP
jgi:RNA polymerase sigma-70 factor (ECF subfamily)